MIKVIKVIMHAISSGHAICIRVAQFRHVEDTIVREMAKPKRFHGLEMTLHFHEKFFSDLRKLV